MEKNRRVFLKKTSLIGVGVVASAVALNSNAEEKSNGVFVGKSDKKEILYKKSKYWEEYYKKAL